MNKYVKYLIALSVLYAIILVASCTMDDDDGCGSFATQFKITELFIDERKYTGSSDLLDRTTFPLSSPIDFDSLILAIQIDYEGFAHHQVGSFMSAAYACSPALPDKPLDTITSIQAYSFIETDLGLQEVQEE